MYNNLGMNHYFDCDNWVKFWNVMLKILDFEGLYRVKNTILIDSVFIFINTRTKKVINIGFKGIV